MKLNVEFVPFLRFTVNAHLANIWICMVLNLLKRTTMFSLIQKTLLSHEIIVDSFFIHLMFAVTYF